MGSLIIDYNKTIIRKNIKKYNEKWDNARNLMIN